MSSCLLRKRSLAHKHIENSDLMNPLSPSVCAERLTHPKNTSSLLSRLLIIAINRNTVCLRGNLMSILETIQKEMTRRKWTRYRLAKAVEGKIPQRTVYGYLSEECDLGTHAASIILEALGLQIMRKPEKRKEVK